MMIKEIAKQLQSLGLGTFNENTADDNTIFLATIPEKPDTCISLFQYAGEQRADKALDNIQKPSLQICVRSQYAVDALQLATDITNALDQTSFTIDGVYYPFVKAKQDPFPLKRDENDRYIYAVNFYINRRSEN